MNDIDKLLFNQALIMEMLVDKYDGDLVIIHKLITETREYATRNLWKRNA